MKDKKIIKISIICILFMLLLFLFGIIFLLYFGIYKSEKDFCLDAGICKKGLKINTEYGMIEINKQNCIKYGWEWNSNTEYCQIK